MTRNLTGGCQCGRVRYQARIDDLEASVCHCRMCQRAAGNIFMAFKHLKKADVRWEGDGPDYYESSPFARRGFCRACGTPLSFDYPDSANMDRSFDSPGDFVPTSHFGIESRLEHWRSIDDLPGARADEYQELTDRWMTSLGKLPD